MRRYLAAKARDLVNSVRPSEAAADDPIAYTREHTASPKTRALLDEAERGTERRKTNEGRGKTPAGAPGPGTLHAYEVTADDAALIRALAGASFGPGATVTLPSGKTITGTEIQQWTENGQPER